MTIEEAVSFGNMWLELNEDAEESETYQFFKMAVSVLSAQNEAMAEEELAEFKKELANAVPEREKGTATFGFREATKEERESVDKYIKSISFPKREKGEWMIQPSNEEQGERVFVWWKCSKCGQVIYSETEKDRKEFHAFCGRCGADMRGEAE